MIENEIARKLEEYSKAYYEGNTLVSDAEYDQLEETLRKINPNHPWFSKVRESSASLYGIKRKHLYQFIGSVGKIKSMKDSKVRGPFTVSAKLDGTSMTVYFKDGKLDYALTRGDGEYGFDITDKYLVITEKYNVQIPEGFTGAIRGEIVMTNKSWDIYKKSHPEASMQRNTGTGLVNRKDCCEELKLLDFVPYELIASNLQTNYLSELDAVQALFPDFPQCPYDFIIDCVDEEDLVITRDAWADDFPLDGLVFNKLIEFAEYSSTYGTELVNVRIPKSMKEAYKFDAEQKETVVRGVKWTLQHSSKYTPVIEVQPIELSGAIVKRMTGDNAKFILDNKIDAGAKLLVSRANEVIPHCDKVLEPSPEFKLPSNCPYCGSKLVWKGVHLRCENYDCPEQERLSVNKFLRCCGGDIKGAGEIIYDLVAQKTISETITKLEYSVSTSFPGTTGHQQRLIQIIKNNILKGVSRANLIRSVNPENVGEKAIKCLCTKDNDAWFESVCHGIPATPVGVGAAVKEEMSDVNIVSKICHLYRLLSFHMIPITNDTQKEEQEPENARYFCVTGTLSMPRKTFETLCKTKGWIMSSLKKCEVLVTNDPNSGSGKNIEAKRLGKLVIDEQTFIDQYLR